MSSSKSKTKEGSNVMFNLRFMQNDRTWGTLIGMKRLPLQEVSREIRSWRRIQWNCLISNWRILKGAMQCSILETSTNPCCLRHSFKRSLTLNSLPSSLFQASKKKKVHSSKVWIIWWNDRPDQACPALQTADGDNCNVKLKEGRRFVQGLCVKFF